MIGKIVAMYPCVKVDRVRCLGFLYVNTTLVRIGYLLSGDYYEVDLPKYQVKFSGLVGHNRDALLYKCAITECPCNLGGPPHSIKSVYAGRCTLDQIENKMLNGTYMAPVNRGSLEKSLNESISYVDFIIHKYAGAKFECPREKIDELMQIVDDIKSIYHI